MVGWRQLDRAPTTRDGLAPLNDGGGLTPLTAHSLCAADSGRCLGTS